MWHECPAKEIFIKVLAKICHNSSDFGVINYAFFIQKEFKDTDLVIPTPILLSEYITNSHFNSTVYDQDILTSPPEMPHRWKTSITGRLDGKLHFCAVVIDHVFLSYNIVVFWRE